MMKLHSIKTFHRLESTIKNQHLDENNFLNHTNLIKWFKNWVSLHPFPSTRFVVSPIFPSVFSHTSKSDPSILYETNFRKTSLKVSEKRNDKAINPLRFLFSAKSLLIYKGVSREWKNETDPGSHELWPRDAIPDGSRMRTVKNLGNVKNSKQHLQNAFTISHNPSLTQ